MRDDKARGLRPRIAEMFRRHCGSCTGSCCDIELAEGFMAFGREVEGLGLHGGAGPATAALVSFNGGRCRFSGSNACGLDLTDRPLDCLSYPVYPRIRYSEGGGKEIDCLVVRKDCRSSGAISKDRELLGLIRELWLMETADITPAELQGWFSDAEYWSDENVIKV